MKKISIALLIFFLFFNSILFLNQELLKEYSKLFDISIISIFGTPFSIIMIIIFHLKENYKPCPFCKESIKIKATKCPHCQSKLD